MVPGARGAAWPASRAACSPPRPLPSGGPRAAELVFVSRQFVASRFVSRWAKSCGLCSAARHSARRPRGPARRPRQRDARSGTVSSTESSERKTRGGGRKRRREASPAGPARARAAGGRLHTPNGTTKAESRDEEERTKGDTTAVKSHIPKTPSARFSQGRRRREHRHAAWRAGEPGHSLLSDSEIEGVEKGNLWPHSLCTISSTVSRGGEKEL